MDQEVANKQSQVLIMITITTRSGKLKRQISQTQMDKGQYLLAELERRLNVEMK